MNVFRVGMLVLAAAVPQIGWAMDGTVSPIESAFRNFAANGKSETQLVLATNGVVSPKANQHVLPEWLQKIAFTPQEANALVSAIGAYMIDQHLYRGSGNGKNRSVGENLALLPLSMAADAAQGRAYHFPPSNTVSQSPGRAQTMSEIRASSPNVYGSAPKWKSREDHYITLLVDMNSCHGAFTSALNKLMDSHPDSALADRMIAVRRDLSIQSLKLDPHCQGGE